MKSYTISQRYLCRGNRTWYGRINEDGSFRYVSLKTKRKSDAVDWLNMMNAARFMPENVRSRMEPDRKDKSIEETYKEFMVTIVAQHGHGSLTEMAYRSRLQKWVRWCHSNGITTLREFSVQMAGLYSMELSYGMAPKTQKEMLRCLRQFVSWCREALGMEDYDPMKTIKAPKLPKTVKTFWTSEEIDMILDNAPTPEFRLFWSLMAFAGLRYSEALSFGTRNIDGNHIVINGKGNKTCRLPIGDRMKRELSLFPVTEKMFLGQKFRKSERVNATLKKAVSAAGLESVDATNHKFRHSFASNLVISGADDKAVQELMRHDDIRITLDTYSHLRDEHLFKAINKKATD